MKTAEERSYKDLSRPEKFFFVILLLSLALVITSLVGVIYSDAQMHTWVDNVAHTETAKEFLSREEECRYRSGKRRYYEPCTKYYAIGNNTGRVHEVSKEEFILLELDEAKTFTYYTAERMYSKHYEEYRKWRWDLFIVALWALLAAVICIVVSVMLERAEELRNSD